MNSNGKGKLQKGQERLVLFVFVCSFFLKVLKASSKSSTAALGKPLPPQAAGLQGGLYRTNFKRKGSQTLLLLGFIRGSFVHTKRAPYVFKNSKMEKNRKNGLKAGK